LPGPQINPQQSSDRLRNVTGPATIAYGTCETRVLTYRAAQAKVVGILHPAIDLDLLAFKADVGQSMLATTVWAAGHIDTQLLIERRHSLLQFLHQPARERLGFRDGQFAEFRAGTGDCAPPKHRRRHG